jgi:hypothetical protein
MLPRGKHACRPGQLFTARIERVIQENCSDNEQEESKEQFCFPVLYQMTFPETLAKCLHYPIIFDTMENTKIATITPAATANPVLNPVISLAFVRGE